jgi:hypothetical protein
MSTRSIPMDVAARVVATAAEVPLHGDKAFAATGVLEPGVHLHWALPDELAKGDAHESRPPRFRGVPDLWLVVRFNPVTGDAARTHRAWVVDSIAATATPLAQWSPPARTPARIHTVGGVLDRVVAGWGEWPLDEPFDQMAHAYYPTCRTRLGFHDDLADVGDATGKVSYAVIGWYSSVLCDPFHAGLRPFFDKIAHVVDSPMVSSLAPSLAVSAGALETEWSPAFSVSELSDPSPAEATTLLAAAKQHTDAFKASLTVTEGLAAAFGLEPDTPQQAVVDAVMPDTHKAYTVLHGSIVDVPLKPTTPGAATLKADDVALYPNLHRALADLAARTGDSTETDWLEMLLGSLEHESATVTGIIDLPGAQHARTFQGVPGRSSWFARLTVYPKLSAPPWAFGLHDLLDPGEPSVVPASGNWPLISTRSAHHDAYLAQQINPPDSTVDQLIEPVAAVPTAPTPAETVAWLDTLRAAFTAAQTDAAVAGRSLHPRLIRVEDRRRNAAPTMLGPSVDGTGPADAAWWLDLGDPAALPPVGSGPDAYDFENNALHRMLAALFAAIVGTRILLPDATRLFEVPGARWYRPWAPHLVIYGAKRAFRFGGDGRFRLDGKLDTRLDGELMTGLRVGGHTVLATDLIADAPAFAAPGLPPVAAGLVAEHALVDAANAPIMARVAHRTGGRSRKPSAAQFTAVANSMLARRVGVFDSEQQQAIEAIDPVGTPASAVGLQVWRDWYGPLFLDTQYTHRRKRFNDAWALPPEHVETVDRDPVVAPDRELVIAERQVATVTAPRVLKSTLVTQLGTDLHGEPVPAKPAPPGIDAATFDKIDAVSCSLTGLDDAITAAGEREIGGFVHVNRIKVFDTFGSSATWQSSSDELDPPPTWATPVPARLSSWGRLLLRLQSGAAPGVEATQFDPPVCGFLLPDFVDQALEVYDADGRAVGQLTATDPINPMNPDNPLEADTTLTVQFSVLPWVAATLPPGAAPLDAITNQTMRRLVEALLAQSLPVEAGAEGWQETGLTAMLRVIDTLRSALDPAFKHQDARVRLLGEPIVVLRAQVSYQASDADVTQLRGDPPTIDDPALPVMRVRIGDVTRPDDGVLGCLIDGATPAEARFAPPSLEAAQNAVLNRMVAARAFIGPGGSTPITLTPTQPVTHPFIENQVSEFDLPANSPLELIVLADARGGLYATCGMLPRKQIVPPRDHIQPAIERMRPTFRIGPILGYTRGEDIVPLMPAPLIDGMKASFVQDVNGFPEVAIPPVLPVAELPLRRVKLTQGWARMSPAEE